MHLHTLPSCNSLLLAAEKQQEAYRDRDGMGKGPEAGESRHLQRTEERLKCWDAETKTTGKLVKILA